MSVTPESTRKEHKVIILQVYFLVLYFSVVEGYTEIN